MQIDNPYIQYMYSYPHKTAYGALEGVDLRSYFNYLKGQENSLYFHVPFCQYKCGYCNLFSLAGQSEEMMEAYVNTMERQAIQLQEVLPQGVEFSDLTLGGGTPLILPEHLLERLFHMAKTYFCFQSKGHSIVVETSPNQTTESKLQLLKGQGVTRVSIGVQSFQEEELHTVSRFHSVATARKALDMIRQAGFACMNIDLIYGIPGQTQKTLLDSLEQALYYEPEELFVYPLYVKPGTGLYQRMERAANTFELYHCVRETLVQRGYQPYSMRRFVKIKQSENQKETKPALCGFGNTLSVGCGGRTYLGNLHFCTPYAVKQSHCMAVLKEYMEKTNFLQVDFGYILNEDEQKRRYTIKHILFGTGIDKSDYQSHFGTWPEQDFPVITEWIQEGYAMQNEHSITLAEEGFALSDYLGVQLISAEVREKMSGWKE